MTEALTLQTNNLSILAWCVTWAMEHDAFDLLKYDPIGEWGGDITHGKEHMG